jgi:hypothetical protein
MRGFTGSCLVLSLFLAACGSDAESAPEAADVASDAAGLGDTAGSGSADTGSPDTEIADTGSADTQVADTTPPPSCGRVGRTGSDRATYDIILPLLERVATAEVTLDGSGVTILPAGETVPFAGLFNPDSNCAQATVNDAPLVLCFYDASGEDAQPLTLGAQLATFLDRQGGGASAPLFGAQRRGVDRYCTVSGHWTVQMSQSGSEGTVAADVAPLVVAAFDYLSLFEAGGATPEMVWNNPPQLERGASYEAIADGTTRLRHSATVAKEVRLSDGRSDEAELTFGWDLLLDPGINRLSGDLTVEVETVGGLVGRLTYVVSGGRN